MRFRPIPGVSLHARERAVLRLGDDPPRCEWEAAVLDIIDRKAALLSTQLEREHPTEVYLAQMLGQHVQLLWRPDVALIVTLVPISAGMLKRPQANNYVPPVRQARGRADRPMPQPYHRARTHRGDWR